MKQFLILDTNICNKLRKNENRSLENFLKLYPSTQFTTISEDFAYYEYLGLRLPSPNIDLKNINTNDLILLNQEIESSRLLPKDYYNDVSKVKGSARFFYTNLLTENFIEGKFQECIKYCDPIFLKSYLYDEIFKSRRSSRSIASNLIELLTADYVNTYSNYSSKSVNDFSIYLALLGAAFEIAIEKRNVHLLRSIKKFWNNRDLELENGSDVSKDTVSFVDEGVKRIKAKQDYFDLELLNNFLMGFTIAGSAYPVEIVTEDSKTEVLSRLVASYSFINQAKKEMKGLEEIKDQQDINIEFCTNSKYTFVDSSCTIIDSLNFKDLIDFMDKNKILF